MYVYGQKFISPENVLQSSKFAILAPKNKHCREIDADEVLNLIPGEVETYISVNHPIRKNDK